MSVTLDLAHTCREREVMRPGAMIFRCACGRVAFQYANGIPYGNWVNCRCGTRFNANHAEFLGNLGITDGRVPQTVLDPVELARERERTCG